MIKSMTAFASGEKSEGLATVFAEIRSYNSRHLDLVLRMPAELNALEDRVRQLVSEYIGRGRIEVRIQFKTEAGLDSAFEIDESRAAAYRDALVRLKEKFGLASEVTLEMLLAPGGIIKAAETETDARDRVVPSDPEGGGVGEPPKADAGDAPRADAPAAAATGDGAHAL